MTSETTAAREWLMSCHVDPSAWTDAEVEQVMDALGKPISDFLDWDGADEFVASLGSGGLT